MVASGIFHMVDISQCWSVRQMQVTIQRLTLVIEIWHPGTALIIISQALTKENLEMSVPVSLLCEKVGLPHFWLLNVAVE